MAQETDAQLTARSLVIRNEATLGANTKERHDDMNVALIDSKVNNDKVDTDAALATASKTLPGRDAVKAYIAAQIAALVASSPATLDTLNEIAVALGNDPNFSTTIMTALGLKANTADVENGLEATDVTGTAVQFNVPKTYGSVGTPETGNITLNATGLVKGMVQTMLHNSAVAPTFGSEFKKIGGTYLSSNLNSIYFHAISATRIEYTINQTA